MNTISLDPITISPDDPEEEARRQALDAIATLRTLSPNDDDEAEIRAEAERQARIEAPESAADADRFIAERDRPRALPLQLPEQRIEGRPQGRTLDLARQLMASRSGSAPASSPASSVGGPPPRLSAPAPSPAPGPTGRPAPVISADDMAAKQRIDEFNAAMEATKGNRKRRQIIGLIGALLGAGPQAVMAAREGGDQPLKDFEARQRFLEGERAAKERGSAAEARSAQERAQADREERRLALAEREVSQRGEIARATEERQARLDESLIGLREIQRRSAEGDAQADASMRDPSSAASRSARSALLEMSRAVRRPIELPADQLEGMSAADLNSAPWAREIARAYGNMRGTAGGGGGGGSGDRASLRDAYVRGQVARGVSEEQARQAAEVLDARTLRSEVARSARPTRETETGEEIMPGVMAGIDLQPGEARSIRDSFAAARDQHAALGRIQALSDRYGASAVVNPQARAQISAELPRLRAMIAQLQNSGVINPGEAPLIEATLPNPRDLQQMTLGEVSVRVRAFQRQLEEGITSGLLARGVDQQGVSAALGMLRTGRVPQRRGAQAQGASAGGTSGGSVVVMGGRRFRATPEQISRMRADGVSFEVE